MNVKEIVKSYEKEILNDLKDLVAYPSIFDNSDPNYPFGKANADCLQAFLTKCERFGLKTTNLDNYIGYGEIGTGEKLIGVIGHLDVVPVTDGWDSDPFELTIKDGKAYGRGTSDDKGALIASLYAIKILQDLNIPLNKRIRLIAGCNEENGSACLRHYVAKEGHVDYGFTPDAQFPGVFGEKGMVRAKLQAKSKIKNIVGGLASNIVCNKVEIVLDKNELDIAKLEKYFEEHQIKFETRIDNDDLTLIVYGVAAHASTPTLGINAINYAFCALNAAGFSDEFTDLFVSKINLTTDGSQANCNLTDDHGDTTINVGLIKKSGENVEAILDIRFPVTLSCEQMQTALKTNFAENIQIEQTVDPLFFPTDGPLVKALVQAYQTVTNDTQLQPMTMGGGTYAKSINNTIAFGCAFDGDDNHIHDVNEFVKIDDLLLQVEIYVQALINLLNIKEQ